MCVRELIDTLDPSLAIEIYATAKEKAPEHLGMFRQDMPESLNSLLEKYGETGVKGYNSYKAYVLIYIEDN